MQSRRKKSLEEAQAGAKRMSERYVERGPFRFFPEPDVVSEVQHGLALNEIEHGYRYCP